MSSIIIPDRKIWTRQPQVPVGLNKRVVGVYASQLGGFLINGNFSKAVVVGGTPTVGPTQEGICGLFSSSSDVIRSSVSYPTISSSTPKAILIHFYRPTITAGAFRYVNGFGSGVAGAIRSASHNASVDTWGFYNGSSVYEAGTSLSNDAWHTLMVCMDGGSTTRFYADGVECLSTSISAWYTGGNYRYINSYGGGYGDAHKVALDALMVGLVSPAEAISLTINPWQIFQPISRPIFIDLGAGGGATTSVANSGSIAITGSSATGTKAHLSSAAAAAITLTGVAAISTKGRLSQAASGTITLTGSAATSTVARVSQAAVATINLTGFSAASTYMPAGETVSNASPGSYNLSGSASTGIHALLSTTAAGAITVTGFAATSTKLTPGAYTSAADGGALSLVGYAATSTYYGALTLTVADLAAIDALIAARIADIAAATLAAAQVTPIHSDMRKAVGIDYHGDGSEGDKLRSVMVP
jgi:hypothetical protein